MANISEAVGSNNSMREYAKTASIQLGWDSGLIYAQWVLETGNFTSNVFKTDNNLAGIKFVSTRNNPGASPGSVADDGGVYAHYPSVSAGVQGYINFIKANPRYSNVKTGKTLVEQATILKNDGWATDPTYVSKVVAIAGGNGDVNMSSATAGLIGSSNGITEKAGRIVKSPIFWIVLLVGLIFKP